MVIKILKGINEHDIKTTAYLEKNVHNDLKAVTALLGITNTDYFNSHVKKNVEKELKEALEKREKGIKINNKMINKNKKDYNMKTTVYVDKELHNKIKAVAGLRGLKLTEYFNDIVKKTSDTDLKKKLEKIKQENV